MRKRPRGHEYCDWPRWKSELQDEWLAAGKVWKLAKKRLEAAQSDNFEELIERAALVRKMQEELESAQKRVDKCIESREKVELRGSVLGVLDAVAHSKEKIERLRILLEWIEQQCRVIASDCISFYQDAGKGSSRGQIKSSEARTIGNRKASRHDETLKAKGRKEGRQAAPRPLGPVSPSKVSKVTRKRSTARQKRSISSDIDQSTEKASINPPRRSTRISNLKGKYATTSPPNAFI